MQQIRALHNKSITVITIAIGTDANNLSPSMLNFLRQAASSPDLQFKAFIKHLKTIMQNLLDVSCRPIQQGNMPLAGLGWRGGR